MKKNTWVIKTPKTNADKISQRMTYFLESFFEQIKVPYSTHFQNNVESFLNRVMFEAKSIHSFKSKQKFECTQSLSYELNDGTIYHFSFDTKEQKINKEAQANVRVGSKRGAIVLTISKESVIGNINSFFEEETQEDLPEVEVEVKPEVEKKSVYHELHESKKRVEEKILKLLQDFQLETLMNISEVTIKLESEVINDPLTNTKIYRNGVPKEVKLDINL